jgi:thiol-disulfide isomerase/thioredoxin
MRIATKVIWVWLFLFLPFLCFKLYRQFKANEKYEKLYSSAINMYVGSKFSLDNFLDSSGADTKIDVSHPDITVVDFWFKDCPPCLKDMKHYSRLIQGRDKQIQVVSICINRYDIWKPLLHSRGKRFAMLSESISNWRHLVLKSNEDPQLHNDVPTDNAQLLENTFQSNKFPMYFVLDKNGIIKATPVYLTKYIELNLLKQDPLWYFLTDSDTWTRDTYFVPSAFVEYSGYFWIAAILLSSALRFRRKNNS